MGSQLRRVRAQNTSKSSWASKRDSINMVPWVKILIGVAAGVPIFIFARRFFIKRKQKANVELSTSSTTSTSTSTTTTTTSSSSELPKTEPEESKRRWLDSEKTTSSSGSSSSSATSTSPKKDRKDPSSSEEIKGVERLVESEEDREILKSNPFVSNLLDDLTGFYAANKPAYMGVLNGCLELYSLERPESIPASRWRRMKPKLIAQISGSVVRALRDLRASLTTEEQRSHFDLAAAEIQQICNDQQFNAFQDS